MNIRQILLVSLVLTLMAPRASAVINATVPLGNTSAPTGMAGQPTDPGFSHVGHVNGSTGVYLGNRWVLTADHVGVGNFSLGGTTYNYNGVDSYQIGGVDLRLFRLSSAPALSPLVLSSTSPGVSDPVVMIGAGRSPTSASPNTWFVDEDPVDWVWETSFFPEADNLYQGFTSNSTKEVRWGTNVVESIYHNVAYMTYSPTNLIVTDFDAVGGTAYESQAVLNDSGSGLFIQNGGQWELAGTIVLVSNYNNQPGGLTSALFGNRTEAIDLSQYSSEINSYMLSAVPEPATYTFFMALFALCRVSRRRGAAQGEIRGCRRCL